MRKPAGTVDCNFVTNVPGAAVDIFNALSRPLIRAVQKPREHVTGYHARRTRTQAMAYGLRPHLLQDKNGNVVCQALTTLRRLLMATDGGVLMATDGAEQLSYPYGIAPNWTRGPIGPLVGFIYMRYDYDNYIISFVHLSPKFWGGREAHQSKTIA